MVDPLSAIQEAIVRASGGVSAVKDSSGEASRALHQLSSSVEFDARLDQALGRVQTKFLASVNDIAGLNNERKQLARSVRRNSREALDTAKGLKEAIKNKDTESTDALRERLSGILKERTSLQEAAGELNARIRESGTKALSFGNKQLTIVKLEEVSVREIDASDIESKKDARDIISQLRDSLAEEKESLRASKDVTQTLRGIAGDVRGTLTRIRDKSITDYDDAKRTADEFAGSIRSAVAESGAQQLVDQALGTLSKESDIVQSLLS